MRDGLNFFPNNFFNKIYFSQNLPYIKFLEKSLNYDCFPFVISSRYILIYR